MATPPVAIRLAEGKGSFAAPFFFLALGFACVGSRLGTVIPWALAASALAGAGWATASHRASLSWLSLAVCAYSLLAVLNTLFVSPAYTAAGLYHPLLLAFAFYVAQRCSDEGERRIAISALAFGALLATWGLVEIGPLGQARAHALFETPATYAAVVNLLLIPALGALLFGRRSIFLIAITVALAAALVAAGSRGGFLALSAGMGTAAILGMRAGLLRPQGVVGALTVISAGWLIVAAMHVLPWDGKVASSVEPQSTAMAQAESSQSRLELYALSWNAWLERPIRGTGYLTFRYVLEQGRAQVPSYNDATQTWFVHNDYLQTLQEMGPIGLAALLGVAVLPPLLAYRRIPKLPENRRLSVAAIAAALAAVAFHGLVDFPFYIPTCLVLYGVLLGALDRRLGEAARVVRRPSDMSPWVRAARAALLLVAGIALIRPVAAEAAAEWGLRKSSSGDGQSAAFWLGVARRIEPADWRYHWYAGQFWDAQATESGRRGAAKFAAEAFSAGFAANPLEVRNLVGNISVHRRYGALLDAPADASRLNSWLSQAEALSPANPVVRRERELVRAGK